MNLVANASTQSRAHRPLPPGYVRAETQSVNGVREIVRFFDNTGKSEYKTLLSWVGGQAGLLWGGPTSESLPPEIYGAISTALVGARSTHGSYGHTAEHALTDALGHALDGVFTTGDVSCRFGLSGRDALDAAVRVARAATGRTLIASDGSYHGAGEALIHPPFPEGVPYDYQGVIRFFRWGDVEAMRRAVKFAAAMVVDVPALPDSEIAPFLAECRRACDNYGAVFILDEVVTGFRLGLQGASGYYHVKPDIACYGKAMSATGGVSAVVGNTSLLKLLDGVTFFSQTFGGMPGPCFVAAHTVNWLNKNKSYVYGTPGQVGYLRGIGEALQDGMDKIFNAANVSCHVNGQPERSVMVWNTNDEWLEFCSKAIAYGVVLHRPQFPTLAHSIDDVNITLAAIEECLR